MITDPAIVMRAIELLQQLSDVFCQRREQLAREVGLTVQQWRVLEEISDQHFMPSLFARKQESTQAAVSKIIRQLLDKGVICVKVSDKDGRQRQYALTESGQQMVAKLLESRQRAVEAIWANIDPHSIAGFIDFSEILLNRLEEYARDIVLPVVPAIVERGLITDIQLPALTEAEIQSAKLQKTSAQIHDIF